MGSGCKTRCGPYLASQKPQTLMKNVWLQVDTLFQELDQIIPNNFMSQTFEDSSASLASATPPSSSLTPAQREVNQPADLLTGAHCQRRPCRMCLLYCMLPSTSMASSRLRPVMIRASKQALQAVLDENSALLGVCTYGQGMPALHSCKVCSDALPATPVQLAELDAQKHAGLVQSVAADISEYRAPDMPALVEFVRDTSARLGVIMTDEAAVLAQFPTWPQVGLTPLGSGESAVYLSSA